MKRSFKLSGIFIVVIILTGCQKDRGINIFTLQQDIEFGQALEAEILSKPNEYPVLDRGQYTEAYQHIEDIRDKILASGEFKYADKFEWKVTIINDDVLNAFAAPGGYMYFYTGIIKFLENEAQFAGVMAHEMAHCDLRHSTRTMTDVYGLSLLLDILGGQDPGKLTEIAVDMAKGLGTLKFSRTHEYQADEYAVKYLLKTEYEPCSLGDFFTLLEAQQGSITHPPVFLSTHPSPEDRQERISANCAGGSGDTFVTRYQQFQNSLP